MCSDDPLPVERNDVGSRASRTPLTRRRPTASFFCVAFSPAIPAELHLALSTTEMLSCLREPIPCRSCMVLEPSPRIVYYFYGIIGDDSATGGRLPISSAMPSLTIFISGTLRYVYGGEGACDEPPNFKPELPQEVVHTFTGQQRLFFAVFRRGGSHV